MKKTVSWPEQAGFFSFLLVLWIILAACVRNPLVLPGPGLVVSEMLRQLQTSAFWMTATVTLGRIILAVAVSLSSGTLLALTACFIPRTEFFLTRLLLLLRSVPNVAFIILALFWLNREAAVLLVLWLLLTPIVYSSLYERLAEIGSTHSDLFHVFPQPWTVRMKEVYLPELTGTLAAVAASAGSLACKAGVMAEILCQVQEGIGRGMQQARFSLNTAGVMAWTIWLLLLASLLDWLLKVLAARLERIQP